MNRSSVKKIHIIGSVGSGKTTLARKLSRQIGVPFYELDNVVWRRGSDGDKRDQRNIPGKRDEDLNKIVHTEKWIIEGVHHTWVAPSFQQAELIIFLDPPYSKRMYRIIKRFILQKIGVEKANYKPTFKIFLKMFEWNRYFEKESKPEIYKILRLHHEKLVVVKDVDEIRKQLSELQC